MLWPTDADNAPEIAEPTESERVGSAECPKTFGFPDVRRIFGKSRPSAARADRVRCFLRDVI